MDYLKQHVLASAPALLVISRYLAAQPHWVGEGDLQRVLQPKAMTPEQDRASQSSDVRGVLAASLSVGEDLGLLEVQGSTRDRRVWILPDGVRDHVQHLPPANSRAFRSLLLRRLCSRAIAAIEVKERPPDVAIGLTWLLLQDPLAPLSRRWGDGPEAAFDSAGLRAAVGNVEQWRAFERWARSLGLVTVSAISKQKSYLVIDPTRALENILDSMPRRAFADQWFQHLYSQLPVLGDPKLISVLPAGNVSSSKWPASTALAVQKLERAGRLRLVEAADATNAVVLHLGNRVRRINEVHVVEGAA